MLRSRSNRQQRPSESTDEQQGRSGGYNYGGYPASSGSGGGGGVNPMAVGIASGADDDYYAKGKQPQQQQGSRFGFGRGGGGNNNNNSSSSSGASNINLRKDVQRDVWDRRNMGSAIKGHPKSSNNSSSGGATTTMMMIFAIAFLLTVALGGATIHYRKANDRMEHELMIVKRRMKTGRFRHGAPSPEGEEAEEEARYQAEKDAMAAAAASDYENNSNDNDNDNNNNGNAEADIISHKALAQLKARHRELQGDSHKWETRTKSLSNELLGLQAQATHVETGAIVSHKDQFRALQHRAEEETKRSRAYKAEFMEGHRSGRTGIVPGGPGHSMVSRQEMERMESLEEYEDYVQRREDALWDKIDLLVEKLGGESRREALEWFGPGPHKVELEIEYPKYTEDLDPSEWPRVRGVLEIQMAPLDMMPIAVNLFLQQIHHKLWNGCSFVINAMHILQAGPHKHIGGGNYDANLPALVDRFESSRLNKMPFQEYHDDYPHKRFTVGFAGRPGGPDFYINKVNNSENHGPGGQSHHDLHEEADPCFAMLVGGIPILNELNRIPTNQDKGSLLLHHVEIVDSRVIAKVTIESEDDDDDDQHDEQEDDQGGGGGIDLPSAGPSPA